MILATIGSGLTAVACAAAIGLGGTAQAEPQHEAAAPFKKALAQLAKDGPMIPGVIMAADSPRLGLAWRGAIGSLELHGAEPLQADDAFRIASVTKVFIAAATLRAFEKGQFGLNDSIRGLISPQTAAVLVKGGYDLDRITVRHLLTHTSGLYDFATDPAWGDTIRENPQRSWTRLEQIIYAVDHGHKLFEPGAEYRYSDTAYSLLSEIIERGTGKPFPAATAELIDYKKLGLTRTHFEKLEPPPPGERRAHQYVGPFDVNGADPSSDLYGGGGIVTTADDLILFIRGLIRGTVFQDPATLPAALLLPPVANPGGSDHTALLARMKLGNQLCWGHSGYWMVLVAYCPDVDLALAVSTNQNRFGPRSPDVETSYQALLTVLGAAVDDVATTSRAPAEKRTLKEARDR